MLFRQFTRTGNQINALEKMDIHDALSHIEGMLEDPKASPSNPGSNYNSQQPAPNIQAQPEAFLQMVATQSSGPQSVAAPDTATLPTSSAPYTSEKFIPESAKDQELSEVRRNKTRLQLWNQCGTLLNNEPPPEPAKSKLITPRSEAAQRKELDMIKKFQSQQPKELLLNKLIHGDLLLNAHTAPVSPRKGGITPRKFQQETISRLYSQQAKYQEKNEKKKYQLFQEERAAVKDTPGILRQSQKIMSKRQTLPLYSNERLKIEVERKNKKLQEMRTQNQEAKKEQERMVEQEVEKRRIGVNAKPMSEKAWQSKVDKLNKEYFTRLEKRNEKNQGQFKDINFKPEINSKSMKILEKKGDRISEMSVEDRLQLSAKQLDQKKQMIESKLKPTFKPTLNSSSKRIHHRSVQNTAMSYYPEPGYQDFPSTPNIAVTSAEPIQEQEKDDSEPDINREEYSKTPEVTPVQLLPTPAARPIAPSPVPVIEEVQPTEYQAAEIESDNNSSDRSIHQISELNLDEFPAESNNVSHMSQTAQDIHSQFVAMAAPYVGEYDAHRIVSISQQTPPTGKSEEDKIMMPHSQRSSQTPAKESGPITQKRKKKLGAFMTGSSNNSSQKGSANLPDDGFFSFKEPI